MAMSAPGLGDDVLGGDDREAGDPVQLGDLAGVRLAQRLDLRRELIDLPGEVVDVRQHHLQDEGVLLGKEGAVQGLFQLADLDPHPAAGQLREHFRVALAGDDSGQHVPAGDAVDVADHRGQLQVRVFQQLLAPLLLRGAGLDQVPAVAGMSAQPPDVLRRHEAARQLPALGDLRQPHRVQLVGLRPPGQRLDLRGVIQHAVKPLALQQEVHRLPVVPGCFHADPGHAPAA
jgi:hypothetical protein